MKSHFKPLGFILFGFGLGVYASLAWVNPSYGLTSTFLRHNGNICSLTLTEETLEEPFEIKVIGNTENQDVLTFITLGSTIETSDSFRGFRGPLHRRYRELIGIMIEQINKECNK